MSPPCGSEVRMYEVSVWKGNRHYAAAQSEDEACEIVSQHTVHEACDLEAVAFPEVPEVKCVMRQRPSVLIAAITGGSAGYMGRQEFV
ncbi:MAG: hypothetical protein AAGB51_06135 [Planctomycetota bacterium]